LAYERFQREMGELCAQNGLQMSPEQLAEALRRRFPEAGQELEAELYACSEAGRNDALRPKQALALVQALDRYRRIFCAAAHAGRSKARESGKQ
jgi:hypothetical protein